MEAGGGLQPRLAGWSRGAKTSDAALATLESYRDRFRPIEDLAGMLPGFDAAGSPLDHAWEMEDKDLSAEVGA